MHFLLIGWSIKYTEMLQQRTIYKKEEDYYLEYIAETGINGV